MQSYLVFLVDSMGKQKRVVSKLLMKIATDVPLKTFRFSCLFVQVVFYMYVRKANLGE